MVRKFKNWFSTFSFLLLVACVSYSCSQDVGVEPGWLLEPVFPGPVCPQNSESMKRVKYPYSILNYIPRTILAKSKLNTISVVLKENEEQCYFDLNIIKLTFKSIGLRNPYCLQVFREAKDENGNWNPIENKIYHPPNKGPFCPGGVLPVHKKIRLFQSLQVKKIPRYDGDFETEIRFNVRLGGNKYYSKPYKGAINKGQFIPIGKM